MPDVIPGGRISGVRAGFASILVMSSFWIQSGHAAKAGDRVRPEISPSDRSSIESQLADFRRHIDRAGIRSSAAGDGAGTDDSCDVLLFEKAADWILRHDEFFKPEYVQWTKDAIRIGAERLRQKAEHRTPWMNRPGRTVLGYRSRVDDSVQPYAVTLPAEFDGAAAKRWPVHVELHGRNAILNEVGFIHAHERSESGELVDGWIQLDVFGRTNNAYRWAGETDVLEALADVMRRFPVDSRRIVVRGFSMGGAGAWHLGLHHPSLWCSVGAGGGFCDTRTHLGLSAPLSPLHQRLVRIYDAQEYALNAFNVPTIGYGGELDGQLFASGRMAERAAQEGVTIRRLIGPQTGHAWHPESRREFMAFLAEHVRTGRPEGEQRNRIRFVTCTPRYGSCDWIRIDEQAVPLDRSLVDAEFDPESSTLTLKTENVRALSVLRADVRSVRVDGTSMQGLASGGGPVAGLLLELTDSGWIRKSGTADSDSASDAAGRLRKRAGLQGPIDDAFMESFICVRGTGTPWNPRHQAWCDWTLARFEREFDRWMRGRIRIVNDSEVTPDMIQAHHLVLFGDPGSNSVIASVVDSLPVRWTKSSIGLDRKSNSSDQHGIAMIYPNPRNPSRYVVINSGHTFHDAEIGASSASLYPRLGDVAVVRFQPDGADFIEETVWANIFDSHWQVSSQ